MSYLTRPLLFRYLSVRYDMLSISEGHLTAALEGGGVPHVGAKDRGLDRGAGRPQ